MTPRTLRHLLVATGLALTCLAAPAASSATDRPAPEPPRGRCATTTSQVPGSTVTRTLTSGDRVRSYRVHLPVEYERRGDWPLVLAFHGRGSDGTELETYSRLSELPAVVVYPEGVVGTGDGDRQAWQGAPYAAPGVDDVRFTEDLLDTLEDDLCVDERRVYLTGKSNGAGLTGLLACRLPDRVAAVAPVAGAFYPGTTDGCDDRRPRVPVVELHGTGDVTIPYAGDAERGLPAVRDWTAAWARRDGCRARPDVTRTEPDVTTYRWRGCRGGAAVTHVAVDGGGHTWPGADVYSGGGLTTQTIEAHQVIWDAVRHHRSGPGGHR